MHARMVAQDGDFLISDGESKNGTFVNGARVNPDGQVLRNGDRVERAEGQVVLRFRERDKTLALEADPDPSASSLVVDSRSRSGSWENSWSRPCLKRQRGVMGG